ncbi:MAG: T9SS type A sorting domain-containing protein [Flavobacteriales bacterium]
MHHRTMSWNYLNTSMAAMLCWLLCVAAPRCAAQNLVPNPSFEEYTICPDSPGQADLSTSWLKFRWTPDYFNSCNANDYCDVPRNAFGYQPAATGSAYAGVVTYDSLQTDFREYLGVELIEPLSPGLSVYLSFKIAPGGWGWYAAQRFRYTTDRIGMFFTTQPWSGTVGPIPNTAAAYLEYPLLDTVNWTTITGTYIPDSAYTYVVLGNSFRDSLTNTLLQDGSAAYPGAYVYFDDVCVSVNPDDCLMAAGVRQYATDAVVLAPNPATSALTVRGLAPGTRASIHDALGRQVWAGATTAGTWSFDVGAWARGTYVLRVVHDEVRRSYTFVLVE